MSIRDGSDWKPFHHDFAAFDEQRAANQNCTIGISFGAPRELAFLHAKTGELIYDPQKNGMLFYFGRDANIIWQHGINALPEEQDGKGMERSHLHHSVVFVPALRRRNWNPWYVD